MDDFLRNCSGYIIPGSSPQHSFSRLDDDFTRLDDDINDSSTSPTPATSIVANAAHEKPPKSKKSLSAISKPTLKRKRCSLCTMVVLRTNLSRHVKLCSKKQTPLRQHTSVRVPTALLSPVRSSILHLSLPQSTPAYIDKLRADAKPKCFNDDYVGFIKELLLAEHMTKSICLSTDWRHFEIALRLCRAYHDADDMQTTNSYLQSAETYVKSIKALSLTKGYLYNALLSMFRYGMSHESKYRTDAAHQIVEAFIGQYKQEDPRSDYLSRVSHLHHLCEQNNQDRRDQLEQLSEDKNVPEFILVCVKAVQLRHANNYKGQAQIETRLRNMTTIVATHFCSCKWDSPFKEMMKEIIDIFEDIPSTELV